ncbi:hypothetical protein BDQ17DRAFT_1350721 [Cyathus striatus]|nr:hypothetical protein BDQ17DRAFT_1350721 [Cyathus striatus]
MTAILNRKLAFKSDGLHVDFLPQMGHPSLHPSEQSLPVLPKLGFSSPPECADPAAIASKWLQSFSSSIASGSIEDVISTLLPSTFKSIDHGYDSVDVDALSGYWRDILAFTWDFRTFEGTEVIRQFLKDRLQRANVSDMRLSDEVCPTYEQPYLDLAWIQAVFTFNVAVGSCIGVVRLVPIKARDDIQWRAHVIYTALESLHGSPELIQRQPGIHAGEYSIKSPGLEDFEDKDPTVLIVGAGHNGLYTAARMKSLGVSTLVVEKDECVGDVWRNRYRCLRLHDSKAYIQSPYIPFPSSMPKYPDAKELGDWLEAYAKRLNLAIWTSVTVLDASQNADTHCWSVTITKANGTMRSFVVKHLIFATGYNGGRPRIPQVVGMDIFRGQVLHSSEHRSAQDHIGKKVVVVGACSSAHDICEDYHNHGVDVTMYQRSPVYALSLKPGAEFSVKTTYGNPSIPVHITDLFAQSTPVHLGVGLSYRMAKAIAELDKDLLDRLRSVGFRTNMGIKEAGFFFHVLERTGGHYLDHGCSQLVIDGKVKLKSDSTLSEFTEDGLRFENGTELKADVVMFCTGFVGTREVIKDICGESVAEQCRPVWGLNVEGELNSSWREIGPKGLWYAMGNTVTGRVYSKHIALQIKAIEDGLLKERYSIE